MLNLFSARAFVPMAQGAGMSAGSHEMATQGGGSTELVLWVPLGLLLVGFLVLLIWSLARGQFRNVEGPARRMLELEEKGGVKIDEHR
ncbi:MAG: cbb3-type cytochrome oxidase assembly protein [Candidatus Tectomicrobia bacterium]|uniref:Cbb3-type cytochrome oxidase assembly protein n=1 Tax=Tectimicrobiota bacterium TaxID=2528274 RepID=A0A932GRE6_UNCTE|nr:cbb3-type cytochrome oxidase assembly protein [Candidatus Tectomicrobia bacterium]